MCLLFRQAETVLQVAALAETPSKWWTFSDTSEPVLFDILAKNMNPISAVRRISTFCMDSAY